MSEAGHFLIVEAPFYEAISRELLAGAVRALESAGATYEVATVPGAFEIPAAVGMAETGQKAYDGYVALGCVIRGETTHYDYVCGECARGLQELAIHRHVAIGFGVLTVESEAQAWARAALDKGDKGGAAAHAALVMVRLKRGFHP
jgi:6,7-dimethyl-8-ribityllumazine synthase